MEEEGERIVVGLVIEGLSGVSRKKCGVWAGVCGYGYFAGGVWCVDGNQRVASGFPYTRQSSYVN